MGSISSLHRHGTSIYAGDWVSCTACIEQRWSGVQVCPVIPLLYETFPAELVRELTELGAWLNEVYMGGPKGLSDVWASLVGGLAGSATAGDFPPAQMLYTIPLPSSLVSNSSWKEQKFKTYSPRVDALPPMSSDTIDGVLRVLVFMLNWDLMAGLNPEALFSTENTMREDAKETTDHLVLIGASHLKRTIPYLKRLGYTVTDATCPGRVVSAASVSEVANQLRGTTVPNNAVVVMDMYGNSSWRWEDEDGTLTTSVKIGSSYHLPGLVTCCTDTTFKKLIEITMPIVKDASCLGKVFIPPLPRYVFGACCSNPDHCINSTAENHMSTILTKAEHLRALLKSELGRHGVTKHWVLEGWRDLIGVKGQDQKESIHSLSQVTAADNVHFTKEGYENLAHAIDSVIGSREKITVGNTSAGATGRRGSFFWRGFTSPVGSTRPRFTATNYNANKQGRQPPNGGGGSSRKRRRQ